MDNKKTYQTNEFDAWAYREELISAEKFLIEKYLDKEKKTVEAGTAGGRILLSMQKMGFTNLHGYDFVPEFIQQAKKRDQTGAIQFSVEDATSLSYPDSSFEQIIYLQQILSAVGSREKAEKATKEAYRILAPEGTALISFCDYNERIKHPVYGLIVRYLKIMRAIKKSPYSIQHLPWFKQAGKPNISVLLDREPYNYWFFAQEAQQMLEQAGFHIKGMASQYQIGQGVVLSDMDQFTTQSRAGMLYFICKK